MVEVWAEKQRYKLTFNRFLNLVSIQHFCLRGSSYLDYWHWRQVWHRTYKAHKPFSPLNVDLIWTALEQAKEQRRERQD